jgi:Tfp pilus assembly protein FimT
MKKVLFILLAVMLLMLCLSGMAFASDGSGAASSGVDWTQLLIAIVGLAFTAVIAPGIKAWLAWLKGRTKNEALQAALSEAQTVADNVVASLQQTVVDGLKAKSADGKLTAEDAKAVYEQAVESFLADLSAQSLAVLENNADDIVAYVSNLLEARLFKLKSGA